MIYGIFLNQGVLGSLGQALRIQGMGVPWLGLLAHNPKSPKSYLTSFPFNTNLNPKPLNPKP